MAMPTFTMRDLLEAGVHFGHHPRRWNPKMAPYLFGVRNNVHIINLEYTVPLLYRALETTRDSVKSGGRVLFVGTKRQASSIIAEAAKRCGQYYVNHRWLGGMLTNWKTVSQSIKRLINLNERLTKDHEGLTKKEVLKLERERDKLTLAIGGIQEMGGLPSLLIVIDTNKEATAIQEANKLGISVIGIIDSNSTPEGIAYPIPGNDDATRAIELYCKLFSDAVLEGLQNQLIEAGIDVGESTEVLDDSLAEEMAAAAILEDEPSADKIKKTATKIAKKGVAKDKPVTKSAATSAEKMEAEAEEILEAPKKATESKAESPKKAATPKAAKAGAPKKIATSNKEPDAKAPQKKTASKSANKKSAAAGD